jgi:phosphonate transport system substrate-binding protein
MFLPSWVIAKEKGLVIGLIPEENIFRQVVKYRPLSSYLKEKLGIEVKFAILSQYGDVINRFVSRNLDGAMFGSFASVLANNKLGIEPLVRPVGLDGSSTVEGYIIVRKDSGIKSIEDLRGKRAVFVDKVTATGYIFPRAYLWENGIRDMEGFFSEYYFTGSHESIVYAVLDRRADVGAVKSRIFKRLIEKDPIIEEEIYILARSQPLPDTTLCIGNDISDDLKARLKGVLINMHNDPKGRDALRSLGASRFIEAKMTDFNNVMILIKKAGITLRSYNYAR